MVYCTRRGCASRNSASQRGGGTTPPLPSPATSGAISSNFSYKPTVSLDLKCTPSIMVPGFGFPVGDIIATIGKSPNPAELALA